MQDKPAPRKRDYSGRVYPDRECRDCGNAFTPSNATGRRCPDCRPEREPAAICAADGCEQPLRKDNRTGYCTPHKRYKGRGEVPPRDVSGRVYQDRACPDCGVTFTPASANHERCPECQHRHRLELRAEREGRNDRETCSVPGCDARLRLSNTTGRCSPHRDYIPDRPVCAFGGCGEFLRKDNKSGYCQQHKTATARVPARTCAADGCDNALRADNQSGYCKAHAQQTDAARASRERYYSDLREQSAERRLQRQLCSVDECTNRIRSDNTSGRCASHIYVHMEWSTCSVDDCEARIKPGNTLGRCYEHRGLCWGDEPPECGEPGCGKTLHRDNSTGFCHEHRKEYRDTYNRDYYQRTQDEQRKRSRMYREEHPDGHRAAASAWNAANRMARIAADARRRLAAVAGMDDFDRELSVAYRLAIRDDPCFYCRAPETHHVDHYFPLAKGGNDMWFGLVRACQQCNNAKYTMCGTAFLLLTGG